MEGIRDGFASDRCFACGLLAPPPPRDDGDGDSGGDGDDGGDGDGGSDGSDGDDCTVCGRRMTWRPAAMADPDALGRLMAAYVGAVDARARRDALARLADAVYAAGDDGLAALAALAAAGAPDLDALRRDWRTLADRRRDAPGPRSGSPGATS